MKDCRRRQVERRGDETVHRCIHKQATTYRQAVDESICDSCPVRVFLQQKETPKKFDLPVVDTSGFPSCEFRHRRGADIRCGVTNLEVDRDKCQRCAKDSKMETAGLLKKAVNFSKAVRRWVAAGRPERSDERVQMLYDKHCSKCSMFQNGRCNSCGCPANTDQPAIRNKLKMATEECPLGQFAADA